MLSNDEVDPRVHESLLGIEHVERRALTGKRLIANTGEGSFRGVALTHGGFKLCFRRLQLSPASTTSA